MVGIYKLDILVFVLGNKNKSEVFEYIDSLYPGSNVDILLKEELSQKPILEKIASFRKTNYDLAIILSEDLQYQTKIHLLKGILLLVKARERKIIDDKGGNIGISVAGFIGKSIPVLIRECILGVAGLLFSLVFLNLLLLFIRVRRKPHYEKKGDYFAYLQSTFAVNGFGGGEPSTWAGIADGLSEFGYETSYFASSKALFKDMSYPVHIIKSTSMVDALFDIHKLMHNYRIIWETARHFSHHMPMAIIQYHDPFDFAGVVLAILFKRPLFLDTHNISQWRLSFWHKIYLTYFARLCEDICLSGSDAVFPVSEEVKELIEERNIKHVALRYSGVDTKKFKPLRKGEKIRKKYGIKSEVVVGYAGSFAINHGLDVLIGAAERLVKENGGIHFLLIGEGGIYHNIKELVNEKNLGDRITLTGNVSIHQIPPYLDACDILVALYTNPDFRNSPVKIFEYMAMEKAVVASSTGQVSRIIDNGEDGLLVEKVDEDSLIEAISSLVHNKDLRIKMGKRARKKVLKNYTWKKAVERMVHIYQELTDTAVT